MTVVPVYNSIIAPDATLYMQTEQFKKASRREPKIGERVFFLMARVNKEREDMKEDDFYPIGVSGTIQEVNSAGYLVIDTAGRSKVDEVSITAGLSIELSITRRYDIEDLDPQEEKEHLTQMKNALLIFSEGFQWGPMMRPYINQMSSIGSIACMVSRWMGNTPQEKYEFLEEDSRKARMEQMESMLYGFLEMTKVTNEAQSAQEQDYQKIYREQAIKKQMDYLQKELEELHPDQLTDLQKYEHKIQDSDMNEDARREAEKILNRLKQEGSNSPEAGMLYDYLDFVTSLCWKEAEPEYIQLNDAEQILNEDHFGLEKVKKRIIQQIAVMNLQKKQSGSILLFVGAPGTGKTSIGQGIAKALGRKYVRVSLGGVRDEADIRGHRRTYIGAMPGRIMDGIQKSGVSNPVMVLDEVDKLGMSYNGDPASALLEVLDPEQNSTFTDHYMNVPYDLSDVFFVCTANSLDTIPEPLLNRMEVIPFSGYTPVDKYQIARRHLIPKAMKSMGIHPDTLEITDDALRTVIDDYTMEAGVRGLKKRIDTICRNAAVDIVRKQDEAKATGATASENTADDTAHNDTVHSANAEKSAEGNLETGDSASRKPVIEKTVVDVDLMREYMDTRPVSHDHILKNQKPGIVTGLAWTNAGGEILFIETMFTKGSGKTIITGQLGDVMKESVAIAISLVKSMFPDKSEMFEKNDLHVHVPAGAVPKDGPSAGITLTTAIASLVSERPVNPEIAMTGEVALRGAVTPIGGLPEKLMAAQRAGITRVFIPAENEQDLKDVAEEVKEKLTIIPVSEVTEVLEQTGILEKNEIHVA